jgi:hypothetical protein
MSEIHSCSYYCTRPACVLAQRDELRGRLLQQSERVDKWLTDDLPQVDKEQAEPVSALTRYNEIAEDAETYTGNALERLRIFCSLAMTGEDWLDAEPFFDAAEAELVKLEQQAGPVALTDKAINAAITAWFGEYQLDYFDSEELRDRMRAAIKAANDFKEAT